MSAPATIKECLNRAADENPGGVALRFRRDGAWRTRSFAELRERAWHVAQMLDSLGVRPGDRVAIFLENSPEWYEIYHGIVGLGATAVPVDAKLREMEVAHILHDCAVSAVFCTAKDAELFEGLGGKLRSLRATIALGAGNQELPAKMTGYERLWHEVSAAARAAGRAYDGPAPGGEDPASFIYTSGTTGRPKGAVLTHRNFISNVEGIAKAIGIRQSDNLMLVLPLHHSFAFTTMLALPAWTQCQVSLVESLRTIQPSMAACRPTGLIAVPLLLEKMLARVESGIEQKRVARLLCGMGLGKVVGRKVQQGLGGRLRLIVSGGAPIGPATLRGWERLGFRIVEGYGVTETAPVLTVNPLDAPRIGTVGVPIDGVEIRIVEPNANGVGEIAARGPNVMRGYHNNPEETAKVLRDGWYHTGDLGCFDDRGYLVINGRKKSLIVNREGKNIYPEEVERQALQSEWVLECLALGYREAGGEVGERVGLLVVPDQERIAELEDREGRRLTDDEIEKLVVGDVRRHLAHLADYKRPRKIQLRFEEFEKTTTQKIKRYLYAIDTVR